MADDERRAEIERCTCIATWQTFLPDPECPTHSRSALDIGVLREHARHEHDAAPRLDCRACRKFAGKIHG